MSLPTHSSRRPGPHSPRRGFTLFELVLALGLFLSALGVVAALVTTGMQASVRSRLQSEAVIRCETKMNEIVAGIEPLAPGSGTFEDDARWSWAVNVAAGPQNDLLAVEVTVSRDALGSLGRVSETLIRYIRDPELFLDAQEADLSTSFP